MENQIMVSIVCCAYNHEKYIKNALDGFIMQKTNFKFEILVHDDASTDATADIIRQYEKKYPDIIKPIYQTENQYSKKIGIVKNFQLPRAKGKYIAICEGDDYWTDSSKLQQQVDALENNPSCYLCVCGTRVVNENGSPTKKFYPRAKAVEGVYTPENFFEIFRGYSFQTSSYFALASFLKPFYESPPTFRSVSDVGDEPLLLYFGYIGNIYYINKQMTCYRINSISSWSRNFRSIKENALIHNEKMIRMFEEFDKYSNYKYHGIMDDRINMSKYCNSILNENFKEIFRKENRKYYKRLSAKERIGLRIKKYTPFLYTVLYRCYKMIRK